MKKNTVIFMKVFPFMTALSLIMSACASTGKTSADEAVSSGSVPVNAGESDSCKNTPETGDTGSGDSNSADSADQGIAADGTSQTASDSSDLFSTVSMTDHSMSAVYQGREVMTGAYTVAAVSDETAKKYPQLAGAVQKLGDKLKEEVTHAVENESLNARDRIDESGELYAPYSSEEKMRLLRFDDVMMTVAVDSYTDLGGAHPLSTVAYHNYDSAGGNELRLEDVLNEEKRDSLTDYIYEELGKDYRKIMDDLSGTDYDVPEILNDISSDDSIDFNWYINGRGLNIFFNSYDIAPYAAGNFQVTLTYDSYPGLIQEKYITDSNQEGEDLCKHSAAEPTSVEVAEVPEYIIETAGEDYYASESATASDPHISLKKTGEIRSDWLDDDKWLTDNGFEDPALPETDDNYSIEGENSQYGYDYKGLKVSSAGDYHRLFNIDLTRLCQTPYENKTLYTTCAKIVDDILYVNLIYGGYSSEMPSSGYMAAIDLNTHTLLWRSQPLVCNSKNFLIRDGAVICGYGFTQEPDYIYILDAGNGTTKDRIEINSAPDYFCMNDSGELRVATYDTDYTFSF
jgi:hypothetical protein